MVCVCVPWDASLHKYQFEGQSFEGLKVFLCSSLGNEAYAERLKPTHTTENQNTTHCYNYILCVCVCVPVVVCAVEGPGLREHL